MVPQAYKHTKYTLCFTIVIGQTFCGILQKQLSQDKILQSHQEVVIEGCEDRRDDTVPRPIPVRLASLQVPLVYGALAP